MSTGSTSRRAWQWFLVFTPLAFFLSPSISRAADSAPPEDLRTVQGRWEREEPSDSKASYRRATKDIRGNKETVTYYDASGNVVRRHKVDFTVSRMGDVKVFTYTQMEVLDGPQKGTTMPGPVSYVYWANDKFFREVWGFLPGQENPPVVLYVWKRTAESREAALAAARLTAEGAGALKGTWRAVSADHAGRKQPDEEARRHRLILSGDTFRIERDGQMLIRGKYTVDAAKKPTTIDMTVEENVDNPDENGKVVQGIVEVSGDELKWCTAEPGGTPRPAEFKPADGTEQMFVVFKREKE